LQSIDAIELCSIESAALYNPHRPIIVHYRGRVAIDLLKFVDNLTNVILQAIDDAEICANTPIADFYAKYINQRYFDKARYAIVEMANMIRLCVVYRFGGTYVDSDFLWTKRIPVQF
jgi:hypothetical protein